MTTNEDKLAAVFTKTSTRNLVVAATTLGNLEKKGSDERIALAWLCDELERRGGGIQDDQAFEDLLDAGNEYLQALLITFPKLLEW